MIAAFALTEPEAGSDAGVDPDDGRSTTRRRTTFVLNGTKHWISNGGFAEFFTVFAKDVKLDAKDEHRRITAFVVTKDLGGVTPRQGGEEARPQGLLDRPDRARERARAGRQRPRRARTGLQDRRRDPEHGPDVARRRAASAGPRSMLREAAAPRHAAQAVRDAHRRLRDDPRASSRGWSSTTYALESMVYLTAGLIDRGLDGLLARGRVLQGLRHGERLAQRSTTRSRSPAATASWRSTPTRRRCATRAST